MGKSTDTLIGVGGAALLVFAIVASLTHSYSSYSENDSGNSSNVSVPAVSTPVTTASKPETTPPSTTKAQTTTPATTKAPATTPAATTEPLEWAEDAVSGTMYVNQSCYSRAKAIIGADTVRSYSYGDAVQVIAITDTGYYKIGSGEYIHGDYLSETEL